MTIFELKKSHESVVDDFSKTAGILRQIWNSKNTILGFKVEESQRIKSELSERLKDSLFDLGQDITKFRKKLLEDFNEKSTAFKIIGDISLGVYYGRKQDYLGELRFKMKTESQFDLVALYGEMISLNQLFEVRVLEESASMILHEFEAAKEDRAKFAELVQQNQMERAGPEVRERKNYLRIVDALSKTTAAMKEEISATGNIPPHHLLNFVTINNFFDQNAARELVNSISISGQNSDGSFTTISVEPSKYAQAGGAILK